MALLRVLAMGALVASCALGTDETGGGGQNLPNAGVVPVTIAEDTLALSLENASLSRPWPLEKADGTVQVYLTVSPAEGPSTIGAAKATSSEGAWTLTLETTEIVAGARGVSQPSVIRHGHELLLGFVTDTGAIGLTRGQSPDFGPITVALDGPAESPSLVSAPDGLLLFVVENGAARLYRSPDDGTTFEDEGEILSDAKALSVRLTTTASGRPLYRAHYLTEDVEGLHFAAAFADRIFVASDINPIAEPETILKLTDPVQSGALLLFTQRITAKQKGIGTATVGLPRP